MIYYCLDRIIHDHNPLTQLQSAPHGSVWGRPLPNSAGESSYYQIRKWQFSVFSLVLDKSILRIPFESIVFTCLSQHHAPTSSPPSYHLHLNRDIVMARANSPCSLRKPMVNQWWNQGFSHSFNKNQHCFGEKDENPIKTITCTIFFIMESIFKIPWWKHSKNPGVAKLMSLSELTSLLWICLTALILSRSEPKVCVSTRVRKPKSIDGDGFCFNAKDFQTLWVYTCSHPLQSPSVFRKVVTVTQRPANLWAEASEPVWNVNPSLHGHLVVRQIWAYFIYNCHSWPPKVRKFWMIPCFFPHHKLNKHQYTMTIIFIVRSSSEL